MVFDPNPMQLRKLHRWAKMIVNWEGGPEFLELMDEIIESDKWDARVLIKRHNDWIHLHYLQMKRIIVC